MSSKFALLRVTCVVACLSSLAGCGSVESQPDATPGHPAALIGTIGGVGDFKDGAATYELPLQVPPGRYEMQPTVALKYSSMADDGLLGMGWYLDLYTEVTRCRKTLEAHGYSDGVHYTADDSFCINGTPLVLTGGKQGKDGSSYHTLVDSYDEIQLHGDAQRADSYFVVVYHDGRHTLLKQAIVPVGRDIPLGWRESAYEVEMGDAVERRYDTSTPGETLLSALVYTSKEVNGVMTPGQREIRFGYETRPDVSSFYVAGGELRQSRRLKTIGMYMPDATGALHQVREYSLDYIQSQATGRSLLASVSECIPDSVQGKLCMPATHFTWENEAPLFQKPVRYPVPAPDATLTALQRVAASGEPQPSYMESGDFDGDGRHELFYYRPGVGAHLYFLNADGSVRKDVDVGNFFHTSGDVSFHMYAADVDNDGALDLPGNVDGQLAFASWNGTDMGKPVPTTVPYSQEMSLVDIDGDGEADVLQAEPLSPGSSDYGLFFYRNLDSRPGHLTFAPRQQLAVLPNNRHGKAAHDHFGLEHQLDGGPLPAIVLASDDRIDHIILLRASADGKLHAEVTTPASMGMPSRTFRQQTYEADINGDGLDDVVFSDGPDPAHHTWHYQLNQGGHFGPVVDTHVADDRSPVGVASVLVGDLYGDGSEEFTYPDQLVVPFCQGANHTVKGNYTTDDHVCSDQLQSGDPWEDLGIYRYAVLKFVQAADGSFTPQVRHDTGLIAQANLSTLGDLRADGTTQVLSAFSAWFADGHFKDSTGKYTDCPAGFGCGLHVSNLANSAHTDSSNTKSDLMLSAVDGLGHKYLWDYYPLSSTKPDLYKVIPVGDPARFIDTHHFYADFPLYVVGGFGDSSGVGQGFLAYTGQYEGGIFDTAAQKFLGFKWHVNTDLSGEIRKRFYYDRSFPHDGEQLTAWYEHVENNKDDLKTLTPDPDHGYYLVQTWECGVPQTTTVEGCGTHASPTYTTNLKHVSDHDYDKDLKVWTDVDKTFVYDDDGDVLHSIVRTTAPDKIENVDIVSTFGPTGEGQWRHIRELTRETQDTTTPINADKSHGTPTTKTTHVQYEYNAWGVSVRNTSDDGGKTKEIRAVTILDDVTKPDFGRLTGVTVSHVNKSDGSLEDLRTVHVGYSSDGYFTEQFKTGDKDPEIEEHDPLSGKVTKSVDEKGTTLSTYDGFGRITSEQITRPGKPTVSVTMRYVACGKRCPPNAVYERIDDWSDKDVIEIFYNIRNESMNDPYK